MNGIAGVLAIAIALTISHSALAAKDSVVVGMRLEPPGLDPTMGAAAAISQITLYNVFEGLTRIDEHGEVGPGLATGWTVSDDLRTFTFELREDVRFSDGSAFDSADARFTFERNASERSSNKRKSRFENMESLETPDPRTLVIRLKEPNPLLLFNLGESTAVIVAPETAETNATHPVGTGPFRFVKWTKGDSVVLEKNPLYRSPDDVRLNRVTFRFVGDANAQVAAMMVGDVDVFPRISALETLAQFQNDPRFQILQGTTEGETVLATNNKRPPLDDVRVRCAIAHAIDREEIIDGSEFGYATPIGSHFPPHHPAYVDLTDLRAHDLDRARALLKEAGHEDGLELTLRLPPPEYARRSGEIVAAQLARAGIKANIENMQWPRWLEVVYKQKNYDLSIVSHVEPNDINVYANPDYYFRYDDREFRDIIARADAALDAKERHAHPGEAQRKLAMDCVNGFLFQLAKAGVARRELKGLWRNWPLFVNDMAAVHWED